MTIEELSKSHVLRTHSKKVMLIVESFIIQNGDDKIIKQLKELGKEHYSFGVTNEFLYVSFFFKLLILRFSKKLIFEDYGKTIYRLDHANC
jgi:hypothetical protein